MAQPPFGATGLDKSDPMTFVGARGGMAPSSMGASEGFRQEVSDRAPDRPMDDDLGETEDVGGGSKLSDNKALQLLQDASAQSRSFFESFVHQPWQRSYKAVRNEHFQGSRYLSDAYKTRSKLFKPKTRSALRKRLSVTAKALFTPGDVVSVQAEDEANKMQVAAAALKQDLLNYRLSTPTLRNGIPWFLTALGARFDADVTSICCSKQFWNYREEETGEMELVDQPNQETGQPETIARPKMRVLIDKPDVLLIEPENVRFDPNCNWTNVAQLSPYVLLQFPMTPDEAWDMIKRNQRSKVPWRQDITLSKLTAAGGGSPTETTGPRSARGGGNDPKQQASGAFKPIWLTEVFMRYEGRDYVYWALNDTTILSDPTPVAKVYPWCFGERPLAIGMGQLEPHRTYQMSAVESWQPIQQEVNDLANLRIDYEKRIVSPPIKALRGRNIDWAQVQRKGADSLIAVQSMDDVQVMEMPDVPVSAFNEASMLNADFDDLAGNFDASSVQTNRDLNETVGGMHLLAEAGNQVSDFDLSVWSETWAQPVILQLLRLEEYYETDQKVLAICGQRAKLWQSFGVDSITDELLQSEVTARVNLGIGATSLPMQRLKNFSAAYDISAKAIAPFITSGQIEVEIDAEAIQSTIFANAGFRDGGKQFFKYIGPKRQPPEPPPPDPKAQAALLGAQAKMQGNQIAQERNQATAMIQARKLNDDKEALHAQMVGDAADRKTGLDIAHMKAVAEMDRHHSAHAQSTSLRAMDHMHDHAKAAMSPFVQALTHMLTPPHPEAPLLASPPPKSSSPSSAMYNNLGT